MIYLDIVGRCGNQMFQYAFAKKIALLNKDKITIDFFKVIKEQKNRNDKTFTNELRNFKASRYFEAIEDGTNKIYLYGSKEQIFVFKIYTRLKHVLQCFSNNKRLANRIMYKIMCHYGIYWYYAPEKLKKCHQKNKFIFGYFENPAYFDDIREVFLEEFQPVEERAKHNIALYTSIDEKNSVCVSFRKWEENEPVGEEREVCGENYYKKAIKKVKETVPNAQFVIFSNDIEWVRNHFDLPGESILESGFDPVYEKMRLMYSCKHFVLSNSTFAWWAQYLGNDAKKIVIAPDTWTAGEVENNPLLQDYFLKVE